MFLLRSVLYILVRNSSPRGPMCFRCLIFSLSGPCELLFLLCFIASWTWEVVMTSAICCPLWSLVCECHKVGYAFTSPVRTECGMFVMCCMQWCMSVSAVFGALMCCLEEVYLKMFEILICLVLLMCTFSI